MKTIKSITYAEIKAFDPCYDPVKFIPTDYSGTLTDILRMTNVPAVDRLWVVVRHTLMTDKELHLYGLACARLSEKYTTDERVKACNDVTERYINGMATREELVAARSAAWSAAAEAAWSAARSAAAAAAAWSAAAAEAAAVAAARSAAWSAAAKSEMEENQCLALIRILERPK